MKNITCQQRVFILLPFSRCDCMLVGAEKSSETENGLRITHFERQLSQITKEKMNMVHSRRCSHVEEECQTLATALRRPIARHISATRRQKDAENENRFVTSICSQVCVLRPLALGRPELIVTCRSGVSTGGRSPRTSGRKRATRARRSPTARAASAARASRHRPASGGQPRRRGDPRCTGRGPTHPASSPLGRRQGSCI